MGRFEPISERMDGLARSLVDAAFAVHKTLGAGLLESVYEVCLCHELSLRGITFQRQLQLPVTYKEVCLDAGLRLDLMIADEIIVEIKAVEQLLPMHEAQLLTYLKLAGRRLGFLINFNVPLLRDGIKRMVL